MPRAVNLQGNMSLGWERINAAKLVPLSDKIDAALSLLQWTFARHHAPVVCWSGGKDSTVALHLALQLRSSIRVLNSDSGVDFPQTRDYIETMASKWGFALLVAEPPSGAGFWEIGVSHGWPIFGKNIAQNVEYAVRSGHLRPQLSPLERRLATARLHISARCAKCLQEAPTKRLEAEHGADLKVVGLRALESRTRARLWVDHGDYYPVQRYYGRNKPIWKVNPIALWTEEDIWAYHTLYDIPNSALYDMGFPRNGCWTCAMAIRHGQLKRLRLAFPALYERLLLRSPMGPVLLQAKCLCENLDPRSLPGKDGLAGVLSADPTFLDTIRFVCDSAR